MKIDRTNYEPLVDAFKKGWHEADDEGDVGNRVRRGVRALLDESNSPQGIRRWAHAVKANSALIDQLEEAKAERAEVERAAAEEAWESGVATALNYAKRGSDGISLKLVTFEGEAWTNPYRREEA